jgi:hypothetical protein
MKTTYDTLKAETEHWDKDTYAFWDPSEDSSSSVPNDKDYFVASIDGEVEILLEKDDLDSMGTEAPTVEQVNEYLADNFGNVTHDLPGIDVRSWNVLKVDGLKVILSVEQFESDAFSCRDRNDDYDED